MYRLKVLTGRIKGASFDLKDEETSIGRQEGNSIVLPSKDVSKRHCVLVVNNKDVVLRDEGSANGTFVNGKLTRGKKLALGDRIAVGDYVLELRRQRASSGNALQVIPGGLATPSSGSTLDLSTAGQVALESPKGIEVPTDFKGKVLFYFDRFVMPMFHSYHLKYEWRSIGAVLVGLILVTNLLVSVAPLLESTDYIVTQEAFRRAQYMARQIALNNAGAVSAGDEGRTSLGGVLAEEGVHEAYVIDLENRIIAPEDKRNKYLASGFEAKSAVKVSKKIQRSGDIGSQRASEPGFVLAIEPIKVLDPQVGRNVVRALALVSVDTTYVTLDTGSIMIVYSKVLIITGLLTILIFFVLYRLTLKPLEMLAEDMDSVLTGKETEVSRDFKFEELAPLYDLVNSMAQRLPRGSESSVAAQDSVSSETVNMEVQSAAKAVAEASPAAVVVLGFDRRVAYVNPRFEDLTGIRLENAQGQEIQQAARDQGFGVFVADLVSRAETANVAEDFDMGGVMYAVTAVRLGAMSVRGFVVAFIKKE